jgi:hypothetical protein
VTDWTTVSSLATAGGTLALAGATFYAVRSSNRSARLAERALLAGMRPVLVPSLREDPDQKVLWRGGRTMKLTGGRAIAEVDDDGIVYLAIGVRNVGSGLALLHGWQPIAKWLGAENDHAEAEAFRRQIIDIYVPAGGAGAWEGALRDVDDAERDEIARVVHDREQFTVDLIYGDQDGGQRTISRFIVLPSGDGGWYTQVARHWNLDRDDPR